MKKCLLLLIISFCFAQLMQAQPYTKAPNVIRLLTYNAHYCKGPSDPGSINSYNTNRFASIIKALDADIVSIQELDSAANGRGKRYLLKEIADATNIDYSCVYGNATNYDGGSIGCGTLVKKTFPISRIKKIALPGDEPRMAVRVDLDDFTFISTHFDLNDTKRIQGAGIISNELDYIRKPVFLAGDLNDSHTWGNGGIALPILTEKMTIVSDKIGNSIPGATNSTSLIDYILYRDYNDSGIKIVDTHIVRTMTINGVDVDLKDYSDHYPVIVDIEMPGYTSLEKMEEMDLNVHYDANAEMVYVKSDKIISKIELYHITGQKFKETHNSEFINMKGMSNGLYAIKVTIGEISTVRKIMKH